MTTTTKSKRHGEPTDGRALTCGLCGRVNAPRGSGYALPGWMGTCNLSTGFICPKCIPNLLNATKDQK